MKNKLIKIILLTLSLIFIISALASCGDEEKPQATTPQNDEVLPGNFNGVDGFTFMPADPSDRGVEEFKEKFLASDFYADFLEYGDCYNFVPEEISNKYGINAFSYFVGNSFRYYVLYDGEIFRVDTIGGNPNADHGFVQFALDDYNGDGFFELLCSYNASREPDENGRWGYCHSHIFVLDSKTKTDVQSYTNYDGIIFFKKGDDGHFDSWQSNDKNPENATTQYLDLMPNVTKIEFAEETVTLTSENYRAVVSVDEGTAHFPVIFDSLMLTFDVKVEMTYLGETFSYTNGTGYLAGAQPSFVCGDNEIGMEWWGAITVITKFTVMKGQVITRDYKFYNSSKYPSEVGTYDLIVEYRGEKVVLEDFLTITR